MSRGPILVSIQLPSGLLIIPYKFYCPTLLELSQTPKLDGVCLLCMCECLHPCVKHFFFKCSIFTSVYLLYNFPVMLLDIKICSTQTFYNKTLMVLTDFPGYRYIRESPNSSSFLQHSSSVFISKPKHHPSHALHQSCTLFALLLFRISHEQFILHVSCQH